MDIYDGSSDEEEQYFERPGFADTEFGSFRNFLETISLSPKTQAMLSLWGEEEEDLVVLEKYMNELWYAEDLDIPFKEESDMRVSFDHFRHDVCSYKRSVDVSPHDTQLLHDILQGLFEDYVQYTQSHDIVSVTSRMSDTLFEIVGLDIKQKIAAIRVEMSEKGIYPEDVDEVDTYIIDLWSENQENMELSIAQILHTIGIPVTHDELGLWETYYDVMKPVYEKGVLSKKQQF